MTSDVAPCYIHGVIEKYTPGASFNYCFECGHVWQTEADMRADYKRVYEGFGEPVPDDISKLTACPLCAHDL